MKKLRQQLDEVFETDIDSLHKKLVEEFGDTIYLVGGAVRDKIMGKESKDMDYLVTNVTLDELKNRLLKTLPGSKIKEVGEKFGIVMVQIGNDDFEFAIPRSDLNRKEVTVDPNISVEEDLKRRDLTFNAIAERLSDGERVYPEGINPEEDIQNKIIRSVGNPKDRFEEDALRILRALQFAARFGFKIEPKTMEGIRIMADNLLNPREVAKDRFKSEFEKAWTKGNKDTKYFFELLMKSGVGPTLYGPDFNPIPVKMTKRIKNPYIVQTIAMFLNGGNYETTVIENSIKKMIELSRTFKDIIENGFDANKHIKQLKNSIDMFYDVAMAFSKIDKNLYKKFEEVTKKPIVPFFGKEWKKWMLPLNAQEIIEIAGEAGYTLKGKAIGDIQSALIEAYQKELIPTSSSLNKSKSLAANYLVEELLPNNQQLNDSINLGLIRERLKNILDN